MSLRVAILSTLPLVAGAAVAPAASDPQFAYFRDLAETRNFAGTAVFVFQPAEEGLGGARAMIKDNLFTRFPCDEIYGLHNSPNGKPGRIAVFPGLLVAVHRPR